MKTNGNVAADSLSSLFSHRSSVIYIAAITAINLCARKHVRHLLQAIARATATDRKEKAHPAIDAAVANPERRLENAGTGVQIRSARPNSLVRPTILPPRAAARQPQ